jgi:predicted alpha/beta-hydrolase family hydrolase
MLFVQGTRDAFGTPEELAPINLPLRSKATIVPVEGGDHSFKVPKRSGRTESDVWDAVLAAVASFTHQTSQEAR